MIVTILAIIGGIVVVSFIIANVSKVREDVKNQDSRDDASLKFYTRLRSLSDITLTSNEVAELAGLFHIFLVSEIIDEARGSALSTEIKMAFSKTRKVQVDLMESLSQSLGHSLTDRNKSFEELDMIFNLIKQSHKEVIISLLRMSGIAIH